MTSEEEWYDNDAGPLVRLYLMTSGRARESGPEFDLLATVRATAHESVSRAITPEQRLLLRICEQPQTVVDIASESNLPVSVVRVLLGDLRDAGLVTASRPDRSSHLPDQRVLQEVIDGLRAL